MDPLSEQNKAEFQADQMFGAIGGHEQGSAKTAEPPHPPASMLTLD